MSIQANPYPLRIEKIYMDKIRVLATQGRRSINMQLCIAVESFLENYEKEHGEIPLPEKE